ncbi:MAG: hypothetical protein ACT6Q7_02860 [Blastomonas fulva]|uniref:hypothetical protein n=1 Tax=Blastomonas fulva TaxID=1550728 RepID=UPI0040337277
MNIITCTALRFFVDFVPDYGQVYGDPNSDDADVRHPKIPASVIPTLVEAGKIEAPEPTLDEMCAEIADAINSADAEPIEPRDLDEGETLTAAPLFTVTHVTGPNFDVFGPGMDAPERVKGKDAANARAAELEAAMSTPIDTPTPEGDGEGETATEDAAPV